MIYSWPFLLDKRFNYGSYNYIVDCLDLIDTRGGIDGIIHKGVNINIL